MMSLRSGAALFAAGVLALSAGFATYYLTGANSSLQLSEEADVSALLAARLPDVNGAEISLGDARDRILVINFWATWCVPCRDEIPDFIKLQSEFGSKGVRFFGIAAEKPDKIPAFAKEFGINYPLLAADHAAIDLARQLGNQVGGLPFTVVLDDKRRIVHRQLGVLKPEKLRSIFAEYL